MRRSEGRMKKIAVQVSAVVMSVFMMATVAMPVWADDAENADSTGNVVTAPASSSEETEYTIRFLDGNTVLETFNASAGETWGPSGDISVRSTFYKDGKDYDIVSGPDGSLNASSPCLQADAKKLITDNMVFTYKAHSDSILPESKTYKCLTEDGSLLYTFTGSEDQIPKTLESGSKVYVRSTRNNDSEDSAVVNVYYTLQKDTDTAYTVNVEYIDDADNSVITTRSFFVRGKKHVFIAPKTFSMTKDGETVYYRAVGSTTITHQVSDTARTYQIRYKKLTADSSESYNWYILFYSSETNRCIGSDVVEVKPGAQAVYKVQKTMEVNGTNYTVNKLFDQDTLSHEYADTNHTTYIYYDPEGYNNSSEVKTKDINIQYVDIANGNVIQSITQQVSSDADTKLSFPDSIDANGIHYLRVAGQVASVDYNYYSPKEIYTVYYYDENNTEFRTSVITTEEVQEVIVPGQTTYRVLPGITRTVVTNTDNGVSTVIATNDATGAEIIPTPADNIQLSNESSGSDENSSSTEASSTSAGSADTGSDDSQDVTIDGVQADDLQTPEGNISLDATAEDSSSVKTAVLVIIGIAALAACAIAAILLVRRARSGKKH
jgi:hypothetical protein